MFAPDPNHREKLRDNTIFLLQQKDVRFL